MSIKVSNAVWEHSRSTGRARLVLLAIADHQGQIGAWPSIATIAKMVNSSERSVQRDIQELVQLGELTVEVQNAPTSRQYKSNLYWVTLPGVTDLASEVTDDASGVTDSDSGVTAVGVQTLKEPLRETLTNKSDNVFFEEFWNAYPKKADKRPAQKAFASALKRSTFDELMAGVIAYKELVKDTDVKFIKNPATWLNADAWENEIQPSAESEAAERARLRKQRDLEASKQFLEEQQRQADLAKPPPNCEHGVSIVRCRKCLS